MTTTPGISREEVVAQLEQLQSSSDTITYGTYIQGLTMLNPAFAEVDRLVQESGGALVNSLKDELETAFNESPQALNTFVEMADNPEQLKSFTELLATGEEGQTKAIQIVTSATGRAGLAQQVDGVGVTGNQEALIEKSGLATLAEETGTSLRNTEATSGMTFKGLVDGAVDMFIWDEDLSIPMNTGLAVVNVASLIAGAGTFGLGTGAIQTAKTAGVAALKRKLVTTAAETAAETGIKEGTKDMAGGFLAKTFLKKSVVNGADDAAKVAVNAADDVAKVAVNGADDVAKATVNAAKTGFLKKNVTVGTVLGMSAATTALGVATPAAINKVNNATGGAALDEVLEAGVATGRAAMDTLENATEEGIHNAADTAMSIFDFVSDESVTEQLLATRAFIPVGEDNPTETQISMAQQASLKFAGLNFGAELAAKFGLREYGLDNLYPDNPEMANKALAEGYLSDLKAASYTKALEGNEVTDADVDTYVESFLANGAGNSLLNAFPRLKDGLTQLYPKVSFEGEEINFSKPAEVARNVAENGVDLGALATSFGDKAEQLTDSLKDMGLSNMFNASSGMMGAVVGAAIGIVSYMASGNFIAAMATAAVGFIATKMFMDSSDSQNDMGAPQQTPAPAFVPG